MRCGEQTYEGGQNSEGRKEDETHPIHHHGRVLPLGDDLTDPVFLLHPSRDVPQLPQDGTEVSLRLEAPSDRGRRLVGRREGGTVAGGWSGLGGGRVVLVLERVDVVDVEHVGEQALGGALPELELFLGVDDEAFPLELRVGLLHHEEPREPVEEEPADLEWV